MVLSDKQIKAISKKYDKAAKLHTDLAIAIDSLCYEITSATGVDGYVDYCSGDGYGFMTKRQNDKCNCHIAISNIIKFAKAKVDINEEFLNDSDYVSF